MKQLHTHTLNDHTAGKQLDTHWRVDSSSTFNTVIISVIIIIINASCKLVGGGVQVGVCLKLSSKTKQNKKITTYSLVCC